MFLEGTTLLTSANRTPGLPTGFTSEPHKGHGWHRRLAVAALVMAAALPVIGVAASGQPAEAAPARIQLYPGAPGPISHILATSVPAGTRAFVVTSYNFIKPTQRQTCVSFSGGSSVVFNIAAGAGAVSITPTAIPGCRGVERNNMTDIAPSSNRDSHWDFANRAQPIWQGKIKQ
jgi:hypothetical protein